MKWFVILLLVLFVVCVFVGMMIEDYFTYE